jgi:hypothetical protein
MIFYIESVRDWFFSLVIPAYAGIQFLNITKIPEFRLSPE